MNTIRSRTRYSAHLLLALLCLAAIATHAGQTMEEFTKSYPPLDRLKLKEAAAAHAAKLSRPLPIGTQLKIKLISGRELSGAYGGLSGDKRRMKLGHRWVPLLDVPGKYLIRIDPAMLEREQKKAYKNYISDEEKAYKKKRKAAINAHLKKTLAAPDNLGTVDRTIIYGYKVVSTDTFGVVIETKDGKIELKYGQIAKMHRLRFKTEVEITDLEGKKFTDIHVLSKSDTELIFYDGTGKVHKLDPRFLSKASRQALGYEVVEETDPEPEPI